MIILKFKNSIAVIIINFIKITESYILNYKKSLIVLNVKNQLLFNLLILQKAIYEAKKKLSDNT